ncbi:hypothetical protein CQW23_19340 [Capsicum baccatum]|uniref:Putative plant transposon protein domain-containing protein n=1 Tax=Capsicum baccatum TaxID=33114 RepID=A0A2G2W5I3_CAPBA|nr:hypothetical protein CQW23_19340 [Capsicum baccatum]
MPVLSKADDIADRNILMTPKSKNPNTSKKAAKPKVTTTSTESESSEQEGSKQTESTQPESEKAESKELKVENTESGKSNSEKPSYETPSTENQAEKEPPVWGTLIKCKNPEIRESAIWKIPEAEDIFLKGLIRTKRRLVIIIGLPGYPAVEKKFRDYGLGWTAKGGKSFCLTVVRKFYTNYQARLESMCNSGETTEDQPLLTRVRVRGVNVDIFYMTINRFIQEPNFNPQDTNPAFYHRLKSKDDQRPWFATLIAEGDLLWLTRPSKRIYKASLTQEAKFWWGVVRTHLMPTDEDNILGDGVLHIAGIDETLYATKTHNPIRYEKNEPRLTLDRGVMVEVNPSVAGLSSVPEVEVQAFEATQAGSIPNDETDKRIRVALKPFATFPARFADLENRFNARSQELTGAELAESEWS